MLRHSHLIMTMPADDLVKLFKTTSLLVDNYIKRYYSLVETDRIDELINVEDNLIFYKKVIDLVIYEIKIRDQQIED
jgi:hypothetical protein